ncbi:hypothetical protein ACFY2T_20250 [Streptomyces sp. NPDC001260]|uniref:hypothetical protein n=1 Tax=Streptomyces sp. NPDC001260 TaxID=3364551 RepID=UPI00367CB5D9
MGRKKQRHARRDRDAARRHAAAYRCGHCHSTATATPGGVVAIHHDDGCPVLGGAVSDLGDTLRAAAASGGVVLLDASTGAHVTAFFGDGDAPGEG